MATAQTFINIKRLADIAIELLGDRGVAKLNSMIAHKGWCGGVCHIVDVTSFGNSLTSTSLRVDTGVEGGIVTYWITIGRDGQIEMDIS